MDKELENLREWKRQAIAVMPPLQEIGKELDIPLGQSIHDKILPGIKRLKEIRGYPRWVEASEIPPPHNVEVPIKEYSGILDIGWYSEKDQKIHTHSDLGPLSVNQVYWLEETPIEQKK